MSPILLLLVACDPDCKQCITSGQCIDPATCPNPPVTADEVQAFMDKHVAAPANDGYWGFSNGMEAPDPDAGAAENHDGNYGIIARGPNHSGIGLLSAKDLTNNSTPPPGPPDANNTEKYCASRSFSWPQFLGATASAGIVEWQVLPLNDEQPFQQSCKGAPFNLQGTYDSLGNEIPLAGTGAGVASFFVERCELSSGGTFPQCPAAPAGSGTVVTGGRATSLRPGVYTLTSSGLNPAAGNAVTTGSATLYVRATANPKHFLETYCYDDNFRWPRVNLTNWLPAGALDFREATVRFVPKHTGGTPDNAPDAPACPASGQKNRVDYCYTTDPAAECFP